MAAPVRVFISAGEASGDSYGASLMEALGRRLGGADFFGCGGKRMRAAGCRTLVDAHNISMVGLVEVLPGLHRAWQALRNLRRAIPQEHPQLAILIDFPDFNLRLARYLKCAGIPVLYVVAPQVWAWRKGRLKTIRRNVNRLLCIFPFEKEFFRKAGIAAEFIGHPLAGRIQATLTASEFRRRYSFPAENILIALLPGSRRKEILLNLPPMLEAARRLEATRKCCFVLPAAATIDAGWLCDQSAKGRVPVTVVENCTYDAVAHAQAAIVASGTAATETALLGTPLVIVYRVSPASWLLGRWLVRVPFYSMVNLVAGREIVPELIQNRCQPEAVAAEVERLLDSPERRQQMRADLAEFSRRLQGPPRGEIHDPIQRAAAIAESMLTGRDVKVL